MLPSTLLAALAPSTLPATTLPNHRGDEVVHELLEALPARWESARARMHVPGLAVAVVMDDEIALLKSFGVRDVETQAPVTPDTAFYIASATKPFVAMAVASLVDEGKLALDDPVKKHLSRFQLADEAATRDVTVRDLLCHAHGLNNGTIVLLDAYTGEITEDRYYELLQEVEPAGRTVYTNVNFTLAGRVLEAVSGRPWRDDLRERIFEPLGMVSTTGYADEMYARENVAMPIVYEDGKLVRSPVRKTNKTMHAAGGLGTSARDASAWLRLNLGAGALGAKRVLSERLSAEMQKPQSEGGASGSPFAQLTGFGLGWMRGTLDGFPYFQHGGGYVGSSALISFVPEVGIGVAVLANTDAAGTILCDMVTRDVYRVLLERPEKDYLEEYVRRVERFHARVPEPREASASAEGKRTLLPAAYAGVYTNDLFGTLTIEAPGESWPGRLGDLVLELHLVGEDRVAIESRGFNGEARFAIEAGTVRSIELLGAGGGASFARQ